MPEEKENKQLLSDRMASSTSSRSRIDYADQCFRLQDAKQNFHGPDHKPNANESFCEIVNLLSEDKKIVLARQLGYVSIQALLARSSMIALSDGSAWCLTVDRLGASTAWNICAVGLEHNLK